MDLSALLVFARSALRTHDFPNVVLIVSVDQAIPATTELNQVLFLELSMVYNNAAVVGVLLQDFFQLADAVAGRSQGFVMKIWVF